MNRLNHGPAIFEEAWRSGDRELRDVGVLWCSNMYDLSLWWGDKEDFGGTRYNNAVAASETAHQGDNSYMWRTNWASHFCTKGYDAFFLAYEETGDPRMAVALNAQVAYARSHIHANTGECRNIGDVTDFMRLYRGTKVPMYREEALRLFRELREKLSLGDLFDQGGKPIVADGPFIDDDQRGLRTGYAKPYIIGYALAGLPWLLGEYPDEPKLRDVVRAVADFLAVSQDPTGGWRYPHPRSSYVIGSQGMEHAVQLTRAAAALEKRGENVDGLLDAIERTLQGRVMCFAHTGGVLQRIDGVGTQRRRSVRGHHDLRSVPDSGRPRSGAGLHGRYMSTSARRRRKASCISRRSCTTTWRTVRRSGCFAPRRKWRRSWRAPSTAGSS